MYKPKHLSCLPDGHTKSKTHYSVNPVDHSEHWLGTFKSRQRRMLKHSPE